MGNGKHNRVLSNDEKVKLILWMNDNKDKVMGDANYVAKLATQALGFDVGYSSIYTYRPGVVPDCKVKRKSSIWKRIETIEKRLEEIEMRLRNPLSLT